MLVLMNKLKGVWQN